MIVTIREDDGVYYAVLENQPEVEGAGDTVAEALKSLSEELENL